MSSRPAWLSAGPRRKMSQDFRSAPTAPPVKLSSRGTLSSSPAFRFSNAKRIALFIILGGLFTTLALVHYDQIPESVDAFQQHLPLSFGSSSSAASTPKISQFHRSRAVKGPPTYSFRENLLPDTQYITGWIGGGHTNDFMTYINVIYLGLLTGRVPIIGPFAPTHVGNKDQAGFIPFGDLYDVDRLAEEIHIPVLEWRDVKKKPEPNQQNEPLGGWTIWARYDTIRTGLPRGNHIVETLALEVSYTRAPERVKLVKEQPGDAHVSYLEVARLSTHAAREEVLAQDPHPFQSEGPLAISLPPDEHLMVVDFAYFMGQLSPWEWEEQYFAPWRVAAHCHWNKRMTDLVGGYLARLFDVPTAEDVPKFIVIHARHGDFKNLCEPGMDPKTQCFAPHSAFDTRVKEIQHELQHRPGNEYRNPDGTPMVLPVIMTSDEQDPDWWAEVDKRGWKYINHGPDGEDTVGKMGRWYPLLIDAAIQSMGHGFIGTDRSTMSMVAARRVESWQNGATRTVRFGYPAADDHHPQMETTRKHPKSRWL